MFRWVTSEDERSSHTDGGGVLVRVATKDPGPVVVCLGLETGGAVAPALRFRILGGPESVVEPEEDGPSHLTARYVLLFAESSDGQGDVDWSSVGELDGPGVPPCRVVVRRSGCKIVSALVGRGVKPYLPDPEVEAALRWHSWGRASELVALKRFETGRGGGEVTVVRPRLRAPNVDQPSLESSGPPEVADGAPGSCWLVKSGSAAKIRREWDRFREYLVDRAHPFLARCESFVSVRPPGQAGPPQTAVLFSTFVGGGELLRPEPLEEVLRGPADTERVDDLIDRVFTVLGPWSHASRPHPLARWRRVFRGNENDWLLFGKYDLTRKRRTEPKGPLGRREFTAGLDWDIAFLEEDHLSKQLLGRHGDGLLHRLRGVEAGYSLTHGDLNPRNVLCEGDDVWLIDFEHVGVAPTLADHARLEANLRLWCLRVGPTDANIEDVAAAIETRLLDHFLGNTGNLGMLGELSGSLDVTPQNLLNVARAIARIRGHAARWCLSRYPDRRDYLAVLYLTVLSLLQYASEGAAPPQNYRVLLALSWVLEDTLCRIFGIEPYPRRRRPLEPKYLISASWLVPPQAPGRVRYVIEREDGRQALPHVAATRGVLQSQVHHLDVFDHSLLVLAYVEALLEPEDGDPLAGFLDPAGLDRRVAESLRKQGIRFPSIPAPQAEPLPPDVTGLEALFDPARVFLSAALVDPDAAQLLKWTALLHDVGKPGTRCLDVEKDPPRVQFHRHEEYGLSILRLQLEHLFPEPAALCRIRHLIGEHHRHHHLGEHYRSRSPRGEGTRLDDLLTGLAEGEIPEEDLARIGERLATTPVGAPGDFALLMVHGYADTLACRGPQAKATAGEVARLDLILLAVAALHPRLVRASERRAGARSSRTKFFRELSEFLREESGVAPEHWGPVWRGVMSELGPWYDHHSDPTPPPPESVLLRARELLPPAVRRNA